MDKGNFAIEIKLTIPCNQTIIDGSTLQIMAKTSKATKFLKKLSRLCKKFDYEINVADDGDEKVEAKNG